jgi:hypothetical protein
VQQGEVIGYVGMTGLATGPHLHYEYLVNGVHKNPQTVQLAGAEPLRAVALQKFRAEVAPLLADLPPEQFAAGPLASVPAAAGPGLGPTPDSMLGRPLAADDPTGYYGGVYRSQFALNY